MKRPPNTVNVTKHGLYLAPVGAAGGFDPTANEGTDTMHVMVAHARQGVLINTMISDGLVTIEPVDRAPDGDWPEQVTIAGLNITGPMLVMQMVDEVDLDALFIPGLPGPHTVTIWARNRDPGNADTVQSKQRPNELEQYRVMFTAQV